MKDKITAIIYGSNDCGHCLATKKFLENKGVKVIFKEIENDKVLNEAKGIYKELCEKKGICNIVVPIVKIKNEIVVGFDREKLDKIISSEEQ